LLLRLADPKEGALYVGASDLREGDVRAWRASIAYLPQRPFLPEGFTLRAVVETFGPEVADDALLDALADVGLLPKLEHYHPGDPLAAKVAMLSAGERQRFALARVLADPSPLLILDEPDANLDASGLGALIAKLPSLAKKRRILLVAHDERLLGRADRVVDLGHPTTTDACRLGGGELGFRSSTSLGGLTSS
jgi:ABC-type transport system involved in cytochrome bd biosynthesis fused ATPase/permease subunit